MADTPTTKVELENAAKHILTAIDRPRERDVIERRFGLLGTKETLEQVGESLGITRERVRQIEKATLIRAKISLDGGKDTEFTTVEMDMVKALHELGRGARVDVLAEKLMGDASVKSRATVTLLAELSGKMVATTENDRYFPSVVLTNDKDDHDIKADVDSIVNALKKHDQPVTLDELHKLVGTYEHPDEAAAIASISKQVAHLNGQWGLTKWPTVNPRNIRDKIFVVLNQEHKPMHFGDIATAVKAEKFRRNNVTEQAIHNELIKDDRFVLIGRGIYALAEWGYKKGSITDVIEDILKQESPLHREEIVRRVLKVRQVREATILLNLQNKPQFKRVAKAQYTYEAPVVVAKA
jgi:predicted Zn-ribbon and HTH transcriptional regulator